VCQIVVMVNVLGGGCGLKLPFFRAFPLHQRDDSRRRL